MYCPVNYTFKVDKLLDLLGIFRPKGILLCHLLCLAYEIEILYPAVLAIVILELHIESLGYCPIDLLLNDPVFQSPPVRLCNLDLYVSVHIYPF